MDNLLETQKKQAQTSIFQTAQMQANQAPVVMKRHPEQMQEPNKTSVRSRFVQKIAPFDKAKQEAQQVKSVQQEAQQAKPLQQETQPDTGGVYAMQQSSVRNNYSDVRLDLFHKNLIDNVKGDMDDAVNHKMPDVPEQELRAYQSMLSVIGIYVNMDPMQTPRAEQAKALQNAMSAINSFCKKFGESKEKNLAQYRAIKYKDYFNIMTNGYLDVDKKKNGISIDATAKRNEPKLYKSYYRKVRYADRRHDSLFPLWEKKTDFNKLNDADLIFKLLQNCGDSSIGEFVQNSFENAKTIQIQEYLAEHDISSEEGKRQFDEFLIGVTEKHAHVVEMMDKNGSRLHAEYTRKLAKYLAGQADVKEQVIKNMRQLFSQKDADMNSIMGDTLIKLFSLMPDYKEQSSLDTPEFHKLLEEQQNAIQIPDDMMIPVYVTVTKEVPVADGSRDAYTEDCLWMQLLEKAYAASGLHKNGALNDRIEKNQEELEKLEKDLKEKNKSKEEISKQVNALKAKQAKQLYQWQHSFEGIAGGQSHAFLATFTGKQGSVNQYIKPNGKAIEELLKSTDVSDKLCEADERWKVDPPKIFEFAYHAVMEDMLKGLENQKIIIDDQKYDAKPFYIEDIQSVIEGYDDTRMTGMLREQIKGMLEPIQKLRQETDKETYTVHNLIQLIKNNLPQIIENNLQIMHRPFSKTYTPYAEEQYDTLCQALREKKIINIGTASFLPEGVKANGLNGESEQDGLVERHAYTVVGVMEQGGHHFVQLRNPWAHGELGYKKTKDSNGVERHTSQRVEAKTSGHFYVEWNHLLSKISHIDFNSI